MTGLIELWIEVGLPDRKALRQACGRQTGLRLQLWRSCCGPMVERESGCA
ncbi:MAG: YaeQ family protein [Nitrospira sp.]|nr:YaeQ family protein [Nitrospira sp.]